MKKRSMILVLLQAGLSAWLVLTVEVEGLSLGSISVGMFGVALHLWAVSVMRWGRLSVMPEVRANSQLVTTPPYRWIRHPMYSGLALFTLGCCLTPFAWPRFLIWSGLLATLDIKARYEEKCLTKSFPGYAAYCETTRRFIPFLY